MQGSIILQLPVSTMLPHNCVLSLPSRQSNCCCCCCSPSTSAGIRHRFPSRRWLNISQSPCIPRFIDFYARCISDTSIQLDDVASDEDIEEELSPSASYCPGPIVHLKTDILDPNSLTLVTKQNLVDSILTSIPVLSEEEQKSLAATPAHPAGLYAFALVSSTIIQLVISNHAPLHLSDLEGRASRKFVEIIALYASCLAGNLVEHLWNFAWPAAIALIHPSLQPVAVMGFFNKLAIFVGGPLVGNLMDHFPRVSVYNCLSSIQAAAQLLSVAMIIHAYRAPISVSSVICRPWFVLLVLAGAVERLSGLALGVAMERDWVVLLAGRNRPIALAQANAVLSRIDLFCEILGASVFGILLSKYDAVTCLEVAASLMMGTLPVVVALNWLTNKLSAGVLDRAKCSSISSENSTDVSEPYSENLVDVGVNAIKIGWAEYLHQPVLPASIAYVLLYFNVVLAPGGLMTAFLTQHGLNPSIIGVFSGLCAFMGVAATFMSAALVKRLGILKAGAAGLIFQALLLTTAVGVYWSGSLSHQTPLLFFLSLIVMSRLGHMSYDVVGQQILQTGIPSSKANLIGITEVSVASLAEFLMLGMAIVANDVSHFGLLAMLSVISVVGSAYVFCRWLLNPTEEQRNLFSFDSQF